MWSNVSIVLQLRNCKAISWLENMGRSRTNTLSAESLVGSTPRPGKNMKLDKVWEKKYRSETQKLWDRSVRQVSELVILGWLG
jgi:hypothetical protein